MPELPEERVRRLAAESLTAHDPIGWFERLYAEAGAAGRSESGGEPVIPWDRETPHSLLADWAQRRQPSGAGLRALVVGCGFGRDAEFVARLGYDTVAFDVSATAVEEARRRHAGSPVDYVTADLLDLPAGWTGAYDLVVESMNVQALPDPPRADAIARIGPLVAPGGTLLVIAVAGDGPGGRVQGPPWPLSRAEIDAFATGELRPVRVERIRNDAADPGRWRAEFSSAADVGSAAEVS
ncbi:Methyltransferase domain-containing protein [Actinopolymorpha cephalotaxi]|uniref:Methyltransferase domain-containing protein n=1 Tax=Actinopolymorpha cephalotaxi TaxID=504797 RepID=A0A1I2K949_9ACTN|nr:class I SAM-dependent methyltransferase [Actinopolymorpha cephalotaxi]NYH85958.1 SAM-dependent methyltransferase [Actinopolymorpha cephalotaxi]SFF61757.1 Methyltransferase domain-containing protein [Actinopolymorpha cephalotaxi]